MTSIVVAQQIERLSQFMGKADPRYDAALVLHAYGIELYLQL